jgi:hypothetical protein
MTWHIVCLAGPTDRYAPSTTIGDAMLVVPFDVPGHPDTLHSAVPDVFATHGIVPTAATADLLLAAIAAYTADVRIQRRDSYDGWTRDLVLHLAVRQPARWETVAAHLERLLAFLTGDHCQVRVRRCRMIIFRHVGVYKVGWFNSRWTL